MPDDVFAIGLQPVQCKTSNKSRWELLWVFDILLYVKIMKVLTVFFWVLDCFCEAILVIWGMKGFPGRNHQQVLVISVLYRANVKVMTQFCSYLIAFGKPACHREVAPRKFDVHSRWLTVYQINNHNTSLLFSPFLRTIRESISVGSPSFYPKIWSTPCVRLITLASHFSLMPHWKTTHG